MIFVDHRLLPEGARCDPIRNVSTARTSDARQNASQWPHRYSPALETNTLLAPGPRTRTWTIASAVAVIAHCQRPPDEPRHDKRPDRDHEARRRASYAVNEVAGRGPEQRTKHEGQMHDVHDIPTEQAAFQLAAV